MDDYVTGLRAQAIANKYYRQVLDTGEKMQVVIMSINPNDDIGAEVHPDTEQVLICMAGEGRAVVDDKEHEFKNGDMVLVRPGSRHNFINTGNEELKIVTIYSPPHHRDGAIHKTKAEAMQDTEDEA